VTGIMQTVKNSLVQAHQANCRLCRIEAGGPLSSEVPEFSSSEAIEAGGQLSSKAVGSESWAHGTCASDTLKGAACRTDRGQTGWNPRPGQFCQPCPVECAFCTDESQTDGKTGFSCKLHLATPASVQLEEVLSSDAIVDEATHITKPAGYTCKDPQKRLCTKAKEWGFCLGYKVSCEYNKNFMG